MNAALLRLILAQVCIHGTMTGMRMATPLLALKEGYSAAAVGMLLALFALTQVFLSLPAGRYADRHGLKRPLIISVAAACSGAGVAVLFPLYPVLCLSALLTGGAAGMALIALQRHVGRMAHNKDELRKVFSWLAIGPAISNFLGPFRGRVADRLCRRRSGQHHGLQGGVFAADPDASGGLVLGKNGAGVARTADRVRTRRQRPGIWCRTGASGACCC
jgi:MFS family permease